MHHMADLGKRNQLKALHEAAPGVYLDGGDRGEILLPRRYVTSAIVPGAVVDVFVYRDSEDRLVATTETPLAMVGDFAFLQVLSWDQSIGAFLDWGLPKDLLLPRREQASSIRPGDWIVVHVSLDEKSDRIVASARINRAFSRATPDYPPYHPVKLLIAEESPLGYNAVVDNTYRGLLHRSEIGIDLKIGQRLDGFVRAVRPNGGIDLALDRAGFQRIAPLTEQIVAALEAKGGRLPYHDKTSPEEIREAFSVSKKAFKQALGTLYRKRVIDLEPTGIQLLSTRKKA
jgi:predicted RNA-binding protein (virulence factor B family)